MKSPNSILALIAAAAFGSAAHGAGLTNAASAQLPCYTANVQPDLSYHDGRLRWAVGVQNVQVIRSAADNPNLANGSTTIYRHHQFLAYWGEPFLGERTSDGRHAIIGCASNGDTQRRWPLAAARSRLGMGRRWG